MLRNSYVYIIIFLHSFCAHAQEVMTMNFGLNSPLETNIIYDIHIAKDGLLYIATDNGFWSYDGLSFTSLKQQKLNTQDITNIQENKKGHIYFQNFDGELFVWTGDRLKLMLNAQKLGFKLKNYLHLDNYWYYWNEQKIAIQEQSEDTIKKIITNPDNEVFKTTYTSNGEILKIVDDSSQVIKLNQDTILIVGSKLNIKTTLLEDNGKYYFTPQNEPKTVNSCIINTESDTLINLQKYPSKLHPYCLKRINKQLILGTQKGLYIPTQNKLYLKDCNISKIEEDQEGNIWVATTTNGLYKIQNMETQFYPVSNQEIKKIDFILKNNLHLISSDLNGNLYSWNDTSQVFDVFYKNNSSLRTKNIFFYPQLNQYVHSGHKILLFDRNFKVTLEHLNTMPAFQSSKGIYYQRDNILIYSKEHSFMLHNYTTFRTAKKTHKYFTSQYIYITKYPFYSIKFSNNRPIRKHHQWILTLRQDTLSYIHDVHLDSVRNYNIPSSSQKIHLQNDRIWIEFEDQLIEYDAWGKVLNTILRKNGIEKNIINLSIDYKHIAISTKEAIYLYNAKTMEYIHKFTAKNGIASIDFDKGWIYDNALYVNGSKGISRIPLDGNYNKGKPKLWIDQILVNDVEHKSTDFKYNQNDIQIQFSLRSFTIKGKLYWRLNGKEWKVLEGKPQIELETLQYGNYTIEAYFENNLGTKTPMLEYAFKISPPYWRTWGFYGLVNLILIGLSIAIWRQRLQVKYREEKRQSQFNLLKMQALQTQMNPHFIFNVQAAIQGLWLEGKEEAALEFQAHFSNLLRQIFQYSGQQAISIEQLITFLEHYVALEKIRFEDLIQLNWQIDPQLQLEDFFIPPLLIQPIIENAFKHGLLHKKGTKKLLLMFTYQGKYLYCKIEDNGVGRRQQAINNPLASGLQTTQNRLNLLQDTLLKKQHPKNNLSITDLKDKKGNSLGTSVEIWVPFINFQKL